MNDELIKLLDKRQDKIDLWNMLCREYGLDNGIRSVVLERINDDLADVFVFELIKDVEGGMDNFAFRLKCFSDSLDKYGFDCEMRDKLLVAYVSGGG